MKNKKLIGITGGIGAGKSIVCSIISAMGYPVFYSDSEAKKLLHNDPDLKEGLIGLFGNDAYRNEELNRSFIAEKVFGNQELLNKMNALVHPAVRTAFQNWAAAQSTPLVFNEAAILFETGAYKLYDAVVLVTAPESIRISRVVQRDNTTAEHVRKRMRKQWTDERKQQLADYQILNDDSSLLIPQVINLLDKLKQ